MLLSNLWKSMKSSFSDPDDSDDPGHETLDDMGVQAMSSAVGKAGGLGLGKLIVKYLEPRLAHSHAGYQGNANGNTGKASSLPADNFIKSR
jgi:Rod binding domain-containing protein